MNHALLRSIASASICLVLLFGASMSLGAAEKDDKATATTQKTYRWTSVTPKAAFAPRDGAGALVFHDKMWLLGGWNPADKVFFPNKCNCEVWSSSDGKTWNLVLKKAPWEGRHTAGYVVFHGKMWIVGGDAIQGHYQSDVWNSADGVQWQKVTSQVPWGPRVLQYTVVHAGKIWAIGGQTVPQFAPADEAFYNDVWNTSDGVNWTRVVEHAPWSPRGLIGGAAVMGGRIWILGGGTYDTPKRPMPRELNNDVWSSADGLHWKQHTKAAPWSPREYHDVAVFDDRLWVMEGWNAANRKDVWYSADGATWHEVPNTPWAPRHAASVFVYDDALWMVAGNNMQSDVWRLDVIKNDAAK